MLAKLSVDLLLIILIIMEGPKEVISPLHHQDGESFTQKSVIDELDEQTKLEIERINDEIKSQRLSNNPNKTKI